MAIPLAFQSAKSLAARIRRGKLGSEELLDLFLARVERHNPKLNAIIATDLGLPASGRGRRTPRSPRAKSGDRCMAYR